MSVLKDIYIEEYERIRDEYTDAGFSDVDATDMAEREAYEASRDRFADKVDAARQQQKDNAQ